MKLSLWLAAFALLPFALSAQNTARSNYENYAARRQQAFKEYIDSRNAEYIRYMKQQWSPAAEKPAMAVPPQPKPVIPPPPAAEVVTPPTQIVVSDVIPKPIQPSVPKTPVAEPAPAKPAGQQFAFDFLGAACSVTGVSTQKPVLTDASEQSVATLWEAFSAPAYRNVVADCLRIRKELGLGDWGYLKMLETLAGKWYSGRRNEATLFQIFLLTQSGFKVRIARSQDRIILLVPSSDMLYGYRYIQLGKEKYFVMGNQPAPDGYHVFDRAFPQEQLLSMRSVTCPGLPVRKSTPRRLVSKRFPEMSAEVSVNLNLLELYNLYPGCDVAVYAEQPLGKAAQEQLYPQLRQILKAKSASAAADMLLNFVQTAFEYQTDQEQFGYERPLFAEETLYYPYCDCEDRAVLYARLVRDLLGLEVILLQYPEHVATAVHFAQDTAGDYVVISGKRYTVCDPTYIGAGVGKTMPGMNNKTVEAICW